MDVEQFKALMAGKEFWSKGGIGLTNKHLENENKKLNLKSMLNPAKENKKEKI